MTKNVALAAWFAGLIVWYVIRYPFARRAKRTMVSVSLFDRLDAAVLGLAWLGFVVVPAVYAFTGFPALFDRPFIPLPAWFGIAAQLATLWLFYRSHLDLGRNWSVSLQIHEQHSLIKTGVYRLIRHPMYCSFFLLAIAQMLLLPNWFVGAAGVAGAGILFATRVAREEEMMTGRFGDEYRDYIGCTKRLVPWII